MQVTIENLHELTRLLQEALGDVRRLGAENQRLHEENEMLRGSVPIAEKAAQNGNPC